MEQKWSPLIVVTLSSVVTIHGLSPAHTKIIVSLNLLFFSCCVCVCVPCIGVIISGQWKNSMRTSTPHKAISVSAPAARGVCIYMCVFVGLCPSLSLHGLWFLCSHTAWQHRSLTIHRPGKEIQDAWECNNSRYRREAGDVRETLEFGRIQMRKFWELQIMLILASILQNI